MKETRESMNKITANGRTIYVSKYNSLENALSSLEHLTRPAWVVMGDYDDPWGGFWVCRPADAARLERAGYGLLHIPACE